jgi:hypothetical protein
MGAMRPVPRIQLVCENCGGGYERMECELRSKPSRFCSARCRYAAQSKPVELTCDGCGTRFTRKISEVNDSNFCSRACYDESRRAEMTNYPKIGARHEHRIVAEQMLGRALQTGEVVHHIDGDKLNNDPSNIEVMTASAHARLHARRPRRRREVAASSRT